MPVVHSSSYSPPLFLCNGHLLSIYPNLFRKVGGVLYRRVRISTPDDDFLDLDYSSVGADRVAVISHGLEGNTERPYVLGMVKALNRAGWDAVAWNFRGCSGEPNRKLRFYHSGASDDLHTVVDHVSAGDGYLSVGLVGFSMGGNITLKYLGERGKGVPASVLGAVAFSVPCDLHSSAMKMAGCSNVIYMKRFLGMLHEKIRLKMALFPGQIDDNGFSSIRTFKEFDDRYTAPLHGFKDAEDYWARAGSKAVLPGIAVPTLLINALDDPFLAPPCYPYRASERNPALFLETPKRGGHVGFVTLGEGGRYWSERRVVEFFGGLTALCC